MPRAQVDGVTINYETSPDRARATNQKARIRPRPTPTSSPCFSRRSTSRAHTSQGYLRHLAHAGLHEDPEAFNAATLDFLQRHGE